MNQALVINGLNKTYSDFALKNVSFSVPNGTIVGLIGENGAGKSTTINAILGLIKKDSGTVTIFEKKEAEMVATDWEQIGVVFDGSNFSGELTPKKLHKVLKGIYKTWDEKLFFSLLAKMNLPTAKKINTFSKGMLMKLSIVAAMAHHPKLLILDEATGGLDPVMRDNLLDLFLDFVQAEDHAILLSSHITGDLEKIADHIVFMHHGEVIFCKEKDELLDRYGIIKCGTNHFEHIDPKDMLAYRKMDYEWQVLIADKKAAAKKYPDVLITPATIDDIMLLYVKGELQ